MTAPRTAGPRFLILLLCCLAAQPSVGNDGDAIAWQRLAPIPDREGFAGPFAGVSNDTLLVAGGANFPDARPWEGGTKIWYDSVFALRTPAAKSWHRVGKLPRPLGYGVALSAREGLLCLGGSDARQHYDECFVLRYTNGMVRLDPLPPLPQRCANACGAVVGRTVYIAGGLEAPAAPKALHTFWRLDLNDLAAGWQVLEPWPGPERMLAVAGAQDGAFYLFSGVALEARGDGTSARRWLGDAYRYRVAEGWKRLNDLPRVAAAAPSPAPVWGTQLVILGGDDGAQVDSSPDEHRGFPREVLAYNTLLDRWHVVGSLPFSLVTTPAVQWENQILVTGGEQRPGVRSVEVWSGETIGRKSQFGWINYTTLVVYLAGMVGIGWYCAGLNKDTNDYFKGGGRIPWWAAGLSIYATMLSSLTFMAIPAKAFASDWTFLWANVPILLLAPVVIRYYLPFFRQLDVTSAYEYLEKRFNLAVRLYGSAAFILFQIGRQAIVLLLPALALTTVSDLDVRTCILMMGALCVAYTVMGGIQAVIWTDVVQSIVLLGSAMLSLVIIFWQFDGALTTVWSTAREAGKLNLVNWTLDPSTTANAFWAILVGNLFITLVPYTSDQTVVQRYLTTTDEARAARAIWTNGLLAIPSTALFFAIGTALYVFYRAHPEQLDPSQPTDAVFPAFIVAHLPVGIAGLAIAGIFAAAQSTVSSSLNSVVTAIVTDFYGRLFRRTPSGLGDARGELRLARILTAAIGTLATLAALTLAEFQLQSLWDAYNGLVGLAGSGLAGLFALGIFTRGAHGGGALLGAIASALVLYGVQRSGELHFFLYAMIGIITCFSLGWSASVLWPTMQKDLSGLTIYDLNRDTQHTGLFDTNLDARAK